MRRSWAALVVLAPLASFAACSDLDGLATASPPDDAAADAPASNDADARDAPATDAPSDAPVAFCASHPDATLCADFDHGRSVEEGFSGVVVDPGASEVTIDGDLRVSPPASLHATTVPFDPQPGAFRQAYLTRTLATSFEKRLHFEISVRPMTTSDEGGRYFTIEWSRAGANKYAILLEVKSGATSITEVLSDEAGVGGGQYLAHAFIARRVVAGEWSRLVVDLSFEDRSLRVTSGGQDVFGDPQTIAPVAKGGPILFNVGLVPDYDPKGSDLRVDDVLLVAE